MSCSSENSATSGQIPARGTGKYQRKASFTQKCNMLSRYLKENGSFGDLNIAMTSNGLSNSRPVVTMDLFPQYPCLSSSNESANLEETTARMTMHYGGEVFVFDDVSAARAEEIMTMARNEVAQINAGYQSNPINTQETGNPIREIQFMNPNFGEVLIQQDKTVQTPRAPILWDLPITRRASLYRFLEKRKDRVAARAPYQARGVPKN